MSTVVMTAQNTRVRNLSNEATYDGNISIMCDKASYAVHHKMLLSVLTNYINGLGLTRDTAIWNRLTALESDTLWTNGSGNQSIHATNSEDTATGNYALAHGYQTWAYLQGSRAYGSGSGKAVIVDGWAQCIEYTTYATIIQGATDTLFIGTTGTIDIPNNYALYITVNILGAAYSGGDKGLTYSGAFSFVIKQLAGVTSKTATDTLAINIEAGITSAVTFAADDTNERLIIQATGTDAGAMFWTAEVKMVMIKFD
jgi:hypothetical protein